MSRSRLSVSVFVAATLFAASAGADVLHLQKGGRLEGILVREDAASITLDVGMGRVTLPKSSITRIERKASALSEFRRRLDAIAPGDVQAYVDLARYAAENGLRGEARMAWTRVASLDPRNAEAHLALGHVLLNGIYVEEEEAYRAQGLVRFDGRWITPEEHAALLRERESRAADDRRVAEARRAARESEERAALAEAEAARAREAASTNLPIYGVGGVFLPPYSGAVGGGCYRLPCGGQAPIWTPRSPAPAPTPVVITRRTPPSSIW